MPDRVKVIRGLECCNAPNRHEGCPYDGAAHYNICTHHLLTDAIALLREQEPVEPIKEPLAGSDYAIWQCGNCKAWLRITDRFCGRCGKAVKRDADGA